MRASFRSIAKIVGALALVCQGNGAALAQFRPPVAAPHPAPVPTLPPTVIPRTTPTYTPSVPPTSSPPQYQSVPSGPPPGASAGGGSGGNGDYPYASYVLPAYCLATSLDGVENGCNVVAAARLGWDLRDAISDADKFNKVTKLMVDAVGPTIVGMAFPTQASLAEKIDLVVAIRDNQVALFQAMERRVLTEMVDNPASAYARRLEAITSSQRYTQVVREAVTESRQSSDRVVSNLQSQPRTSRMAFRCSTACGQAVHVYRTGLGFDSNN